MSLPTIEEVASQLEKNAQADGKNVKTDARPMRDGASPELDKAPVVVAEETPDVEPAPTVTPEPKKEEKKDPVGAKFAALSRREKEARERQNEAERRFAEAERVRAEIDERAKKIEERERAIATARRPVDVLKAHGLTYADVTNDMVGNYQAPEVDPVDSKLNERLTPLAEENKTLKAKLDEMSQTLAEIQAERVEAAKRDVRTSIEKAAEANGCEMIINVGDEAYTLVQEVIRNFYQTHKKVLSFAEACDKVEQYYVDRVSKLAETPKMRSRFAPPPPAPTKPSKSAAKPESPTLTQSLSQGSRATSPTLDKLPKHEALALLATQLRYKD